MTGDRPALHVGPHRSPVLEEAVVAGGGAVVALQDATGIIYHGTDEPAEVAAMIHPGIRWVQLPHAGVGPWVDAGVVTRSPVWTSATGAYGPQVAEHALALMLLAARGLHTLARVDHWTPRATRVFAGSSVALVGFGGIGRHLLRLLAPFDCAVVAVGDSGPVAGVRHTVRRADYREVLPEADYVVLLAPSTPQTRGMIGGPELARMRSDAWLVNVARGDLVVTDDLVAALRDDAIGGAALDVTDPEPLPAGHPLWSLPRAMITPHAANPEAAQWAALATRVAENTGRFRDGRPLIGLIDPAAGF